MSFPVVAQVIASALVSVAATKVIGEVAEGLGMSDSASNLLGIVGGIVAGGMAFDAIGGANAAKTAVDAGKASALADSGNILSEAGSVQVPAGFGEGLAGAETAGKGLMVKPDSLVSGGNAMAGVNANAAAESAGLVSLANKPPASVAGEGVSGGIGVDSVTEFGPRAATAPKAVEGAKPWYKAMWDSDKTGDVFGGAAQGIAGAVLQGDIAEEADERRAAQEAEDLKRKQDSWAAAASAPGAPVTTFSNFRDRTAAPQARPLMQRRFV